MSMLEHEDELWADINGCDSQVSTFGRIKLKGKLTAPYDGVYLFVRIQRKLQYVHQLVLNAFVCPRPEGMYACHKDGDKHNNKLSNLRWDSRSANEQDKVRHGTSNRGERCGTAKITEDIVKQIRERVTKGESQTKLANEFGLGIAQISRIVSRKRWAHVA